MKALAIGRSKYLLNAIELVANQQEIVVIITGPVTADSLAKEADFSHIDLFSLPRQSIMGCWSCDAGVTACPCLRPSPASYNP